MLFNSYLFLFLFLPLALAGYYLCGALSTRIAAAWLCVVSLVFYGWWNPQFVVLLAGSIAFNYTVGLALLSAKSRPRTQRWVLIGGITANLSVLFRFKYLAASMQFLAQIGLTAHGVDDVILPLGVSFFTFTQIGFLLDCKGGTVRERGLISYIQFVTFFPHLVAGPILHHREMMPQFAEPKTYRFNAENMSVGGTLFVIGLAKKVLLADNIAPLAEHGFAAPGQLQFAGAWVTVLAYALQLYFDFSGYSDMAMGLAKMFGVRFPMNFNSPYKALNIIDFWQRWHMTLTRYLTLYLYNPVAMSVSRRRAVRGLPIGRKAAATPGGFMAMIAWPTTFTMGLAGIWHGAGWQFLIFGLLHALYLSINHAWRVFHPPRKNEAPGRFAWASKAGSLLLTFGAVLLAQVFFRAASVPDALRVISATFGLHGFEHLEVFPFAASYDGLLQTYGFADVLRMGIERWSQPLGIALLLLIVWCAPNSNEILGRFSPSLERPLESASRLLHWRPSAAWGFATLVLLSWALINLHKEARFLYFQF
ncbi:D-alanyl-lipoteichoic acid acyltransferase DltB, MBOAT superfamily [Burkholderia sp. GAS332]|uniref:MBOAT family O-acyltransferase n=1 Tax=Paraburkholderia sediminicola TaxID=458836 RepID=UPI000925A042|nr:D-alanyl-lipoteichoic acid acyltransferase DltB, MBOAT superfamily [Burkholderia sp. GAS332]